jgi:hypothetical protein
MRDTTSAIVFHTRLGGIPQATAPFHVAEWNNSTNKGVNKIQYPRDKKVNLQRR